MTKPKIYISAPMRGVDDQNYPLFEATVNTLVDLGCSTISPPLIAEKLQLQAKRMNTVVGIRDYFQADCHNLCLYAYAVVVVGNFYEISKSKGVRAEVELAKAIDIPVFKTMPWNRGEVFEADKWLDIQNENMTFSKWLEDKGIYNE